MDKATIEKYETRTFDIVKGHFMKEGKKTGKTKVCWVIRLSGKGVTMVTKEDGKWVEDHTKEGLDENYLIDIMPKWEDILDIITVMGENEYFNEYMTDEEYKSFSESLITIKKIKRKLCD